MYKFECMEEIERPESFSGARNENDVYPVAGKPDGQSLVEKKKRYSIEFLVDRWIHGEKAPLNSLLKAFKLIKELPAVDEKSFTYIAGIHGQPFITRRDIKNKKESYVRSYWGGYCAHGNVLFPVWHRAYVNYLEQSLQSVLPDSDVMMAFWDELSDSTREHGVPRIFLAEKVWIDGRSEKNPLKSFTFKMDYLEDQPPVDDSVNYRHIDYTTVRFPLFHSEIGSDEQNTLARELNNRYYLAGEKAEDKKQSAVEMLNTNVREWLYGDQPRDLPRTVVEGGSSAQAMEKPYATSSDRYRICLNVQEYTHFSNTTSMRYYREKQPEVLWSLEQPHNDIHVALGKETAPYKPEVQYAYGDMGFNETAAFDPIFYFHHGFIDRIFWLWQKKHEATECLTVIENYPGTNSSDDQGPTPGTKPDQALDMSTKLYPFKKPKKTLDYLTGDDVTNILKLGFDYEGGTPVEPPVVLPTLTELVAFAAEHRVPARNKIVVHHVDRTMISGPFTVVAYLVSGGTRHFVGYDTIFNRLVAAECANCMETRYMTFVFDLRGVDSGIVYANDVEIEIDIRGQLVSGATLDYTAEFVE